jgi:hypothetical protein
MHAARVLAAVHVHFERTARMHTPAALTCVALVLLSGSPTLLAQDQTAPSPAPPSDMNSPSNAEQKPTLDWSRPVISTSEASPSLPTTPSDPLLLKHGPWTIKFGLFAGTQIVAESNGFWGLSDVFAPTADYSEDRVWNEAWLVPSVRFDYAASNTLRLYAGLAAAATGNIGRDIFDQGNSGRVSLENAFGGVRIGSDTSDFTLDLSGGQQPYRLASGFLIDLGAQNGNQRGAALVSPRRSWEYTGVAKLASGRFSADVFVLNYNEITSDDPDTTLAGGKVEYRLIEQRGDEHVGLAYIGVLDSDMPYIRAPVEIIENGREDTQTVSPYLRLRPFRDAAPGLYVALDGAYQWNDSIDLSAHAVSAEVGHQWEDTPLRPKISYAFRQYSGDDPGTSELERFDPLFYDGGVHAFASGSNAALAFYNTNVRTHRFSVNLTVTPQDFLTVSYWRVEASEVNSPLQFGQAGRIQTIDGQPVLVSGVPDEHLSDDFYVEYVRMISPNAFLTLGVGVSLPGDGLEAQAGRSLDPWVGGLVNLTFQF